MICKQCVGGKCKKCMKRNATKDYPDCDCQHRGYLRSLATSPVIDPGTARGANPGDDSRVTRHYRQCNTCHGTGTIQVPFPGKGVTTII